MQGCVISAFEIRDSHTENDIRKRIIDAFGEKLKDLPEPKFKFVRAVGNKIIDLSNIFREVTRISSSLSMSKFSSSLRSCSEIADTARAYICRAYCVFGKDGKLR